jgi:hypothetical protein
MVKGDLADPPISGQIPLRAIPASCLLLEATG